MNKFEANLNESTKVGHLEGAVTINIARRELGLTISESAPTITRRRLTTLCEASKSVDRPVPMGPEKLVVDDADVQ